MRPLWNNVLLRTKKSETKVGGIVIPGQENTKSTKASVLSVGDGTSKVKVGQTVFVAKEKLIPLDIKGETLHICIEKDILGVCLEQ